MLIASSQSWLTHFQQRSRSQLQTGRFQTGQSQTDKLIAPSVSTASVISLRHDSLHIAEAVTITNALPLVGTVVPRNLIQISSPIPPSVNGLQILEMRVEAGDRVVKDQVLAVLDSSGLRAQLAQAEANLAQAEADVQRQQAALAQSEILHAAAKIDATRYTDLFKAGAISQEQLGERQVQALTANQNVAVSTATLRSASTSIDSQVAEINRIKALLAQTVITAPADGTIAERFTTAGDTAIGAAPLYSLIENHQLVLSLQLNQQNLTEIDLGTPVEIFASSTDRTSFARGNVYAIEPALNSKSRQATVKVTLPEKAFNLHTDLRAGAFITANIVTERRKSIVIPASAVVTRANGDTTVFVLSESTTSQEIAEELTEVTLKRTYAQEKVVEIAELSANAAVETAELRNYEISDPIEIVSGLPAGSRVIVESAEQLQDGNLVKVLSGS